MGSLGFSLFFSISCWICSNSVSCCCSSFSAEKEEQQHETELEQIQQLIEKNKEKPSDPIYEFEIETRVAGDAAVQVQKSHLAELDLKTKEYNYRDDHPMSKVKEDTRRSVEASLHETENKARTKALLSLESTTKLKLDAAKKNIDDAGTRVSEFDKELLKHAND